MDIVIHGQGAEKVVEVVATEVVVRTSQEALELFMSLSYAHETSKVVLHLRNIVPDFFVLKSRIAGEVLQKVVNYRMQLAIVGDFSSVESESLQAFIRESNRGRHVFFVESVEEAKRKLAVDP